MYTVSAPIKVITSDHKTSRGKEKSFLLNLNAYRNTHYFTLNRAKIVFKEMVRESIETLPVFTNVRLTLTLYLRTNRSADLSNICSIVDKFFCDALVEFGKLPDDGIQVISSVDYRFGGVDKTNPRVDVNIQPE